MDRAQEDQALSAFLERWFPAAKLKPSEENPFVSTPERADIAEVDEDDAIAVFARHIRRG